MSNTEELQQIGLISLERHLKEQMRVYDLTPRIVGDRLVLGRMGDVDLICRCFVLETPMGVHAAITPVAIDLSFQNAGANRAAPAVSIGEIVVGIAEDKRAAVVQATHTWSEGVFPPILRAFDPRPISAAEDGGDGEQRTHPFQIATQDTQTGAVQDWEVFLGPPQVGSPDREAFGEFVSDGKLVRLLLDALTELAGDVRLHWVKVYVAFQVNDVPPTFECKLDNADWPEGTVALRSASWPAVTDFTQYRQFLTMRPSDTVNHTAREHLEVFVRESSLVPQPEPVSASPSTPSKKRSWWPFGR